MRPDVRSSSALSGIPTDTFRKRNDFNQSLLTVVPSDDARSTDGVESVRPNYALAFFLFWGEKMLVLVDFLQIFGLLWITAQPWRWPPFPFVRWTRWTVYANLDFFSAGKTGALDGSTGDISMPKWGMLEHYPRYFYAFLFAQAALVAAYLALTYGPLDRYGSRAYLHRPLVRAVLLAVLYVLYLPVSIAVLRVLYCEGQGGGYPVSSDPSTPPLPPPRAFLSADPSLLCYSPTHLGCVVTLILFFVPIFVGFPYCLHLIIADGCVYSLAVDHEKRLQGWELGFLLGVDSHWLEGNVWVFGSYTRAGAATRLHVVLVKAALVLLSFFLRSDFVSQASATWWVLAVFCLCHLFWGVGSAGLGGPGAHRVSSTEVVWKVLLALLLADVSLAVVNAFGMRNAVTTASTQTVLLLALHCLGLLVVAAALLLAALSPLAAWPSVRAAYRLLQSPVLAPKAAVWVAALRSARSLVLALAAVPAEVTDPKAITASLAELRRCWLQARAHGSVVQLLLADALEDTLLFYSLRSERMYRLNEHWDEAYVEACRAGLWSRRAGQFVLVPARKRLLLQKLFSLRLFQQRGGLLDADKQADEREARQYHAIISSLVARSTALLRALSAAGDAPVDPSRRQAGEELLFYWDNVLDTMESYPALLLLLQRQHLDKVGSLLTSFSATEIEAARSRLNTRASSDDSFSIASGGPFGAGFRPAGQSRERGARAAWDREVDAWYSLRAALREALRDRSAVE